MSPSVEPASPGPGSSTTYARYGTLPDGRPVHRLVLGVAPGPVLELLELGATAHRLQVPVAGGEARQVLLSAPTLADRWAMGCYLGTCIGRYANRIAGARFALDGREVRLAGNDRGHNLHAGPDGFDRALWSTVQVSADHAVLELVSPDGDQGFPGRLVSTVRYEVRPDRVRVEFTATTDAPTLVNLTTHPYFNLDGEGAGDIRGHRLQVPAKEYTPTDGTGIPLGAHASVAGTPFDLRVGVLLGERLGSDHEQVAPLGGFDHNWVVPGSGLREMAVLTSTDAALRLSLHSDQPGLQIYTGNGFDGTEPAGDGGFHHRYAGVALEPQHFPDSPHHAEWPSTELRPGQEYRTITEWRFAC